MFGDKQQLSDYFLSLSEIFCANHNASVFFRFTELTLMMKTTLLIKQRLCILMVNCGISVLQL